MLLLTLFLIVTFILQALLFRTTWINTQQRVRDDNSALLASVTALFDAAFSKLSDEVSRLTWDETMLSMVVFPNRIGEHQIFDVVHTLRTFAAGIPYIQKVSLLCWGNNMVYSSFEEISVLPAATAANDLARPVVGQIGDPDCVLVQTEDGQMCLLYHFIAGSYGYLGTLLVYLDVNEIFSGIYSGSEQLLVTSSADILLFDSNGSVTSGQIYTPPSDDSYLQQTSTVTGLTFYHDCAPVHFRLGNYITSGNGIFLIFVILPLICMLSLFAAWLFYRPLRNLLHTLGEDADGARELEGAAEQRDDWSRLDRAVSQMSTKTAQYDGIIKSVSPYIQSELLCRLLDGAAVSGEDIRQTLANIQSPLPVEGTFVLFVVRNKQSGVLNEAVIQHTVRRLQNLKQPDCQFFSFDYRYTVLTVAALATLSAQDLDRQIEEILNTITVYTGNLPDVSVLYSAPFYGLSHIQEAHQNALSQPMHTAAATPDKIQIETQICQSISTIADQPEAAGVLVIGHLISSIESAGISNEEKILCYRMFFGEMGKLAQLYRVKSTPPDLTAIGIEEISGVADTYACHILHQVFVNLDNRQHKYLVAAIHYMNQHYMDSGLSLNLIAEEIGISASYLSRIFADTYHMRFTQMLNHLRIEKSKELLADETILIRDISTAVGFLTIQNFMRVFKQLTGVTPSEYRAAQSAINDCRKDSGVVRERKHTDNVKKKREE